MTIHSCGTNIVFNSEIIFLVQEQYLIFELPSVTIVSGLHVTCMFILKLSKFFLYEINQKCFQNKCFTVL